MALSVALQVEVPKGFVVRSRDKELLAANIGAGERPHWTPWGEPVALEEWARSVPSSGALELTATGLSTLMTVLGIPKIVVSVRGTARHTEHEISRPGV